jgi:hypothetical protein
MNWDRPTFSRVVLPLLLLLVVGLWGLGHFRDFLFGKTSEVFMQITSPSASPSVLSLREERAKGIASCDGKPLGSDIVRRQTDALVPFGVLIDADRESFVKHFPKDMYRLFFSDRPIAAVAFVGRIPSRKTNHYLPMFFVYFKTTDGKYCVHHTSIVSRSPVLEAIALRYE